MNIFRLKVKCRKVFLNQTGGEQRNETDVGNSKHWNAVAAMDITIAKV